MSSIGYESTIMVLFIFRLCLGRLALALFLMTSSLCAREFEDTDDAALQQPDNWTQLASDAEIESVLELLAARTRLNYEQLTVWSGAYTVRQQEELPAQLKGELFGDRLEEESIGDVIRDETYVTTFVIDLKKNLIYRSKRTQDLRWVSMSGGDVASPPGVHPYDFDSVVTSEHFIQFMPDARWPAFADLPDFPQANDKRAAFREPADKSARQNYGDLPDPRLYFGVDPNTKFWEGLGLFARAHRGELGSDSKQIFEDTVDVYESTGEFGRRYRVRQELLNTDKTGKIYTECIYESASGFNPVRYVMASDSEFSEPLKTLAWDWVSIDDIWIPRSYEEKHYSQGAAVRYSHSSNILQEEVRLNGPVDSGQFTYKGLGLTDDDIVIDKIEGAVFVLRNGKPRKLANFGEKYTGPSSLHSRWLFLATVSLVVLVVIASLYKLRSYASR